MSLNRPFYEGRPIGSIGALARALGVDGSRLRRTATRADRLYEGPIIITRPGRNPRTVFSASPKLRDIQQRILDRVLRRVHFPGYLMGHPAGVVLIRAFHSGNHMVSRHLTGRSLTHLRIEASWRYGCGSPLSTSRIRFASCCACSRSTRFRLTSQGSLNRTSACSTNPRATRMSALEHVVATCRYGSVGGVDGRL